ncbi:MAG TPA: TIGR02147 family protein [Bdellovibrionales bacterium]|nr:TIGR02147 family protein [Bdellovibrionales bacterium]
METRPDPFKYHDATQFLGDFISYLKKTESGFSVRSLAENADVSTGYVSNVLHGSRRLTNKGLRKLLGSMSLTKAEESYLLKINQVQRAQKNRERVSALHLLQRFRNYSALNPNESQHFRYFSKWYHAAIRELAAVPGFSLDANWIRQRLKYPVMTSEIEKAVGFLLEAGFLAIGKNGRVTAPEKRIEGHSRVLSAALTQFHQQMFELAKQSMDRTHDSARSVMAHTFAIPTGRLEQAKEIARRAIEDIARLEDKNVDPDAVYQFSMALFPLSKTPAEIKNED